MTTHATPGDLCTDACRHLCDNCEHGLTPCQDFIELPTGAIVACQADELADLTVEDVPRVVADTGPILICEPRKDCADANINRWHCMRGHDGAAPDVCPLTICERRGANQ